MKIVRSSLRFNRVIWRLIMSHSFLVVTIAGNIVISASSFLFYFLEKSENENILSFVDAIWWGFTTATTVGYGDIVPVTTPGRFLGILLMLMGTALFATYTAMFAQIIIEDEFFRVKLKNEEQSSDNFLKELIRHRDLLNKQIDHYQKKDTHE